MVRLGEARHGEVRQGLFLFGVYKMKFDIDVSALQPGSVVEQSVCEKVIGFSRSSNQYEFQFNLMQLAEHISRLLWKDGRKWTVTTKDGTVCVLTHEQASKYNTQRFQNAIDKMRRCNRRLVAVEIAEIPKEHRAQHDEAIAKQSRILQGMRVRQSVELSETKRSIPLGV